MRGVYGFLWVVSVLLVFALGAAACKKLSPPPTLPFASTVAEPEALPPVDLYVDDSWSMRGYLGMPGSRYRHVVDSSLEKLITAGYDRSIIRFSDVTSRQAAVPVTAQSILSAAFYNSKETPLATLLDRLSKANRAERLVVVVTDLVQSEKTRAAQEFIESFRRAAGAWPEVLILGFRSAFHGTYFVETLPTDLNAFELHLDGTAPESSRPFYLIVLAPSRRSLDDFRKYVVTHLSPDVEFHASERPIEWPKIDLLPTGSFGSYRKVEPLPGRAASTGFIGAFVERGRPSGDQVDLHLRFSGSARLPLRSPGEFAYDVARLRGKDGEWEPAKAGVSAQWGSGPGVGTPGPVEVMVRYQVPRVAPYSWETYRVRVRAGRANVAAPPWVADWTIRDDRLPPNEPKAGKGSGNHSAAARHVGSRTLNLALVIEAMLRGITEEVVISEQYLRLARER